MKTAHKTSFGTFFGDIEILPMKDFVFFQEGPGLRKWQWTDDGIKVINGRNILLDYSIDLSNTDKYISIEEFNKSYSHFEVEVGDIVVTSSGTLGKVGRINQSHLPLVMNTSVIRFQSLDSKRLDADYLYSFLRSDYFQNQAKSYAIGAAQQNFGPSHLNRMKILLPPIETQLKIGIILSKYDNLIENNVRRIAILEEMAQAIYRQWFVNFGFPGNEHVKLVESSLGHIPDGWEVKTLGEVVEIFDRLRKPLSKMQRSEMQGRYPYYGASKIFDYIDDYIFDGKYLLLGEDGSVITSDRKPVLQLAYDKFWVNNHAHVLRGIEPFSTNFIYLKLSDTDVAQYITGAAQPKINQGNLKRIPILVADDELMRRFNDIINPFIESMRVLACKNENLRTTRDILLSEMISGKLDLSKLKVESL